MPQPLNQLEDRLAVVERELAELRRQSAAATVAPKPRRKRKRRLSLIEEADASHDECVAILDEVLAEMGISGEPVGAEKLRQMMIDAGVDPNDNSFSREIIAMREE